MQTTIKPKDLVRTHSGRTCTVIEIRSRGFRLIEDCATGDLSIVHVDELFLVKAARVHRWPSYEIV